MSAPPVLFEAKVMTRAANLSHLGIPQNLTIRYGFDRGADESPMEDLAIILEEAGS
jgi:hypothetical protein